MDGNSEHSFSLGPAIDGSQPDISLDVAYLEGLIGRIVEAKLAEGPIEAECDHLGMRAEVMCQVMRNHAQVASSERMVVPAEFDADKIVSDFGKIWRAIEG